WELCPTLDHVVPIARGGSDDESNWVTTSMLRNSAKANWTLEELGWTVLPDEQLRKWDGLTNWFVGYLAKESRWRDPYIRRWELAALRHRTAV
ncbi:MAG TPA: HNH endonuclease, partial [Thermoanaerobaculia bacterium]